MPSQGHTKRLRRLEKRASPEIKAALASGKISPRFADSLLYVPLQEQVARLNGHLAAKEDRERRSQIAAQVIKEHLSAGRRDLLALKKDLLLALAIPTT
jgi:hypothetical protein